MMGRMRYSWHWVRGAHTLSLILFTVQCSDRSGVACRV